MQQADVVIVGAGIAGASLGRALAGAGLGVVLLEASSTFEDRVRGEQMHVWGVVEARALGVEQVLLDAGAHVSPALWQYIEGDAEPRVIPLSRMVPGVGGMLNVRHPDACQALLDAAVAAGAKAVRGVRNVTLSRSGSQLRVSFDTDGGRTELTTPLVVGADGRSSTVRKQAGIALEQRPAVNHITGLLLDGIEDVPDDHDVSVAEGDDRFVLFHQGAVVLAPI